MLTDISLAIFFYLMATIAVVAAVGAVVSRHILQAALHLVVVLAMSAGLYLLLGAEFLAGVQILVYVGGIVVLLVFSIMLTASAELLEDRPSLQRRLLGFGAASMFFVLATIAYSTRIFPLSAPPPRTTDDVVVLGRMLLDRGSTGYVVPFEIVSLLLLAVIVGAIVVARKKPAPDRQPETREGTTNA